MIHDDERKLPQIRLKLLRSDKQAAQDIPEKMKFLCNFCKQAQSKFGGMRDAHTKSPKYMCESCAIDQFQADYGFRTREAAAARRRRIFDVPYLFQDLLIQEYLRRNKIKFKDLASGAFEQLFALGQETYAGLFGPEYREYLEELEQWELEIVFKNFTERTPPELLTAIDPQSVVSPISSHSLPFRE